MTSYYMSSAILLAFQHNYLFAVATLLAFNIISCYVLAATLLALEPNVRLVSAATLLAFQPKLPTTMFVIATLLTF